MSRSDPERAIDRRTQVLRRRVALPGGRAIVGGLLVAAAALGVFAVSAGAGGQPATSYVTVVGPVPPGQRLEPADLQLVPIDLPGSTAALSFDSLDEAVGAITLAPLEGGELLARSGVLAADADTGPLPPSAEFSFPVERERAVDGSLQPGERVDVLATYDTTDGGYTTVITRDARVTAIAAAGSDTLASPGTLVLTLAVSSPDEVLALAHASEVAAVTVVRATRAASDQQLPNTYRPESDEP
jgi:Flp pilus assembly protein CpaB